MTRPCFLLLQCLKKTANNLNNNLKEINNRAFQWKMSFNPDLQSKLKRSFLIENLRKKIHPKMLFNNISVSKIDSRLIIKISASITQTIFDTHLQSFHKTLLRSSFDQTVNYSSHQRLKSIQYNAALLIMGAIENYLEELGFESLQSRIWFRKLSLFCKIIKSESLSYLYLIPELSISYSTCNS